MTGPMHTNTAIELVEEMLKAEPEGWCPLSCMRCNVSCVCYGKPHYTTNGHPENSYVYPGYCNNPMLLHPIDHNR